MSKDLIGQRFGRLKVVKKTDKRVSNRIVWSCKCDCGNYTEATTSHLCNGHTTSCGCAKKGVNRIDISNRRFGRLVAISPTDKRLGHSVIWHCQCDCGNTADIASTNLIKGYTKSCGCFASDVHRKSSSVMMSIRADDYIDGTDVRALMQSPSAANTSGTVGVSYDKSVNVWKAYIQFKGKRYRLGSSTNKTVAIALRKEAEQRLHGDFLEWYFSEHPDRKNKLKSKKGAD